MSSFNLEDLIPKTKFDTDKLIELDLLSSEEIAPILPELLAWMRDMNWPVAREMPQLLAKHQKLLVPHIIDALAPEQDECDWKRWIISQLLTRFDEENLVQLKPVLKRIIDEPTWGEKSEDVDIEAADFLLELKSKELEDEKDI